MTTGKQDDTAGTDAMPVGIASTDQLGLLVEAEMLAYYAGEYGDHSTARARLRDFAAAAVAEERERLKADAQGWGNALNEAGWEATEAYRRHTGQAEPAVFFNHAKGIVRDAVAAYFKALGA